MTAIEDALAALASVDHWTEIGGYLTGKEEPLADALRALIAEQEEDALFIAGQYYRAGLEKAIEVIQGEDYPLSHGLASVEAMVRDIEDVIAATREVPS
jgi:HEPN domain-containing protein